MEESPPMTAVLYPPVEPYESGLLEVADGQSLYWETVGNPAGIPVLYLHGGPGSGCTVGARRFFDPEVFRAVLFDQRGCGRSLPLASSPDVDLTVNTTAHIVEDIERLRGHLGIERWIVTGLSWGGVSLGLVYAQAFPARVQAMAWARSPAGRGSKSSGSPVPWAGYFRVNGKSSWRRCRWTSVTETSPRRTRDCLPIRILLCARMPRCSGAVGKTCTCR